MTRQPSFNLTRRAALDLRDIYDHSLQAWGKNTADQYIKDLYSAMGKAAASPDTGILRRHRATPFLMIPARKHFVIYDRIPGGIVVLTLIHQAANTIYATSRTPEHPSPSVGRGKASLAPTD